MGKKIMNSDVFEILSKNIKRYRIEANMTQKELAKKANYTHQFIRRIEAPNVQKSFSLEALFRIAKALDKSVGDMFIQFEDEKDEEKIHQ